MKLTNANIVITGVGVSVPIPVDTRQNGINIWGAIVDGGASTYAVEYTTTDVYAPGFVPGGAGNSQWTTIPSSPVGGSKPFNITALGVTAIRLNVTVGPATVTLGPVFQGDSTQGA